MIMMLLMPACTVYVTRVDFTTLAIALLINMTAVMLILQDEALAMSCFFLHNNCYCNALTLIAYLLCTLAEQLLILYSQTSGHSMNIGGLVVSFRARLVYTACAFKAQVTVTSRLAGRLLAAASLDHSRPCNVTACVIPEEGAIGSQTFVYCANARHGLVQSRGS